MPSKTTTTDPAALEAQAAKLQAEADTARQKAADHQRAVRRVRDDAAEQHVRGLVDDGTQNRYASELDQAWAGLVEALATGTNPAEAWATFATTRGRAFGAHRWISTYATTYSVTGARPTERFIDRWSRLTIADAFAQAGDYLTRAADDEITEQLNTERANAENTAEHGVDATSARDPLVVLFRPGGDWDRNGVGLRDLTDDAVTLDGDLAYLWTHAAVRRMEPLTSTTQSTWPRPITTAEARAHIARRDQPNTEETNAS